MKKRLIVLSALAFTSLTAIAGGPEFVAPQPPPCFDGLYFGGGIGAISGQFNTNTFTDAQNTPESTDIFIHNRFTGGQSNVLGTLFFGYGQVFEAFYAGVEVFGSTNGLSSRAITTSFSNNNNTSNFQAITNNTKVRLNSLEGGVDGRLGYVVTPMTMVYARVGVTFNNIKNRTETIATSSDPGFPLLDFISTRSKSVAGLRVGGGIEQCLDVDWSLRADYIYTNYGSVTLDTGYINPNSSAEFDAVRSFVRSKVSTNTVLFSLVYHLNNWV